MNAPPPPPPTMSEVVKSTAPSIGQGRSLADLYRKAKAKGVLAPRSHYQ